MAERRSRKVAQQLRRLPAHQQARMLRAFAAAEGLDETDLVRLALEVNNPNPGKARGAEDIERLAVFWGPILGMKPERFRHLAETGED